jgi:hypothetical protein
MRCRSGEWERKRTKANWRGERRGRPSPDRLSPVHGALAQSQFSSAAADVATSLCPLGTRAVWGSPTSDGTADDMGETLADRRAALSERCKSLHQTRNGHGAMDARPQAARSDGEVIARSVTSSCWTMAK